MNIDWFDLRKLRYLVTVAQELSFSKAARRLNMAQPPLSQQIKKIEQQLGFTVFERSTRQVSLTRRGERLIQHADKVLESHYALMRYLGAEQSSELLPLRLGAIGLAIDVLIAPRIAPFHQQHPDYLIDLEEGTTQQLISQCHAQLLDAAVIRLHQHALSDEHLYLLKKEPYVLAVPRAWQLTAAELCLSALARKPYISYPRDLHPELYDEINQAFAIAHVRPKLVQQVKTKSATLALVANQVGFAIVPASLSEPDNKHIDFIPIKQALPSVDYYLYCRDLERHPGLRALLRLLKEELNDMTPPVREPEKDDLDLI
ncbi:hypothetical protein PRUB_b0234 [Pseudoalteromonas rubra]|uniref:HTH lysR-type domain-containing protein n=1 Tax=Pseudoalteromonas rubra TaxID=43658 RepID=A0A8T0BYZ8_9GAMM|nr:LysR family transcriptional regulator [Pseudoalteromonas rubra]KAF7781115.1 hypothetical protein PRUB_b0234 [Pseudoalteromonas rubra]